MQTIQFGSYLILIHKIKQQTVSLSVTHGNTSFEPK